MHRRRFGGGSSWARPQYPKQSTRQRERGARYENHTNPISGHVTHGLKPGAERGLFPKEKSNAQR